MFIAPINTDLLLNEAEKEFYTISKTFYLISKVFDNFKKKKASSMSWL